MSRPNDKVDGPPEITSPFEIGAETLGEPTSEKIICRSYDHQRSYDITLTVVQIDGDDVIEDRLTLLPETTESPFEGIPAGRYELSVSFDEADPRSVAILLDESPAGTAVIEVGNGILSLTEGL